MRGGDGGIIWADFIISFQRPDLPMIQRCLFVIFLVVLSASCAQHRPMAVEEWPLQVESEFSQVPSEPGAVPADWFRAFNDPVLTGFIETALRNNFGLKSLWARLESAALSVDIAGVDRAPQLDLIANVNAQQTDLVTPSGQVVSIDNEGYSAGVSVSWEVDLWGRIKARQQFAAANFQATQAELQESLLLLTASLARVYFDLQTQTALKQQLAEQVKIEEALLKVLYRHSLLGSADSWDGIRAQEQNVLSLKESLSNAEQGVEQLQHALAALLGESPISFEPSIAALEVADLKAAKTPAEVQIAMTPERLLKSHPTLKAQYARVLASDAEVAQALANRLPSLSLSGSYERASLDLDQSMDRVITSELLRFSLPIFNAHGRRNVWLQAKAQLKAEWEAFAEQYLAALSEVEQQLAAGRHQHNRLAQISERAAYQQGRIEQLRLAYAQGQVDVQRLLGSLSQWHRLNQSQLLAQRELLEVRIALPMAVGGPLDWTRWAPQQDNNDPVQGRAG